MKQFLVILIVALFSIAEVSAQNPLRWTRLHGPDIGGARPFVGPNGEIFALISPFFGYTPVGYPLNSDGYGYSVSKNNGVTWDFVPVIKHQLTEPANWGLVITSGGVYFYYMISNSSQDDSLIGLYRSTDQGNSWEHIFIGSGYIVKGTTNNAILYNTNETTYLTIDDGKSWILATANYYGTVIGANDKYVFFANYNNTLTRYSIADRTFTDFATLPLINSISPFPTMIASDLLVAYSFPYLIKSDGIQPWDTIRQLRGILSIVRGNGDAIIITATDSAYHVYVLISNDRGSSWDSLSTSIVYNPNSGLSLNCSDPHTFLYDDGTAIYTSIDKGSTWKEIGVPYESVDQLIVTSSGRIFANPTQRYINGALVTETSISSDNGDSWKRNDNNSIQINQIGRGPNGSVLAIAPTSLTDPTTSVWLYDSTLASQWKKRSTVQEIGNDAMIASDSKYIYISSGETLFQSDDNGLSWAALSPPNTGNPIYSLTVSDQGVIYFGSAPAMYRSDDNGSTWVKLHPVNDPVLLTFIKTFGTDGVLLGTQGDGLMISNDKGNSWSRMDGNNFDTVTCIAVNSKGVIAAGTNKGLWIFYPVKQSWAKVTLGIDNELYIGAIDVSSSDDFYVGTHGSSVWMGTSNYNSVQYTGSANSSMRITPNPTSGKITIDLPSEEHARLEVYDMLGRRIALLASGTINEQISYNTSNLPNGIYAFMLTGAKNETQKLVVNH